jgi:outer membrane receptor protein involved in Fe transport
LTVQFNSVLDDRNELTWGAEFYSDNVDSSRTSTNEQDGVVNMISARFPDGSSMDSAAVYANNTWTGDSFNISGGIRYSWFDIRIPRTATPSGNIPGTKLTPTDLTGDIHLTWILNPDLRFVANAGRGFRPPNIFDLGTLGARPGNRFNVPNNELKPESVWSYDLGFKYRGSSIQAEIFGFYSNYNDKITSVSTGAVTPGGREIVRAENLNSVTLYGLESGIHWYPAEQWRFYLTLNYTHGEETSSDGITEPADRVPPLNGRAGVAWSRESGLRLESWLDFAGRQDRLSSRDFSDPRINPEGTGGWGVLNILASWQTKPGMEFGVRLENLLDSNYREHGSGIDAPGRNFGIWINATF